MVEQQPEELCVTSSKLVSGTNFMLQKLPKTAGDTITLGTPVAIGICPDQDKKTFTSFVSFERGGELISYEVTSPDVLWGLNDVVMEYARNPGREDFPKRDLRCKVVERGYEILEPDGEVLVSSH